MLFGKKLENTGSQMGSTKNLHKTDPPICRKIEQTSVQFVFFIQLIIWLSGLSCNCFNCEWQNRDFNILFSLGRIRQPLTLDMKCTGALHRMTVSSFSILLHSVVNLNVVWKKYFLQSGIRTQNLAIVTRLPCRVKEFLKLIIIADIYWWFWFLIQTFNFISSFPRNTFCVKINTIIIIWRVLSTMWKYKALIFQCIQSFLFH